MLYSGLRGFSALFLARVVLDRLQSMSSSSSFVVPAVP